MPRGGPGLREVPATRIGALTLLALASAAAVAQQDVAPAHMRCVGPAASWSIDVGPENALLDRATEPRERAVYRGALQRFRDLDPEWLVWRGQSIRQSNRVLAIAARREACMAGTGTAGPADYHAVVSFADGTASPGCCSARFALDPRESAVADYAAKAVDDWSRQLPLLAPGVVACVNDARVPVSSVASAAPLESGRTAVVLRGPDGALQECVANLASRRVETLRPAVVTPGTLDRPRLLPAREQAPLVTCGRLERALVEDGRLVGYLHYDPCD